MQPKNQNRTYRGDSIEAGDKCPGSARVLAHQNLSIRGGVMGEARGGGTDSMEEERKM